MRISPLSWRWTQDYTAGHRNLLQLNTVSADEGLTSNTSIPARPSEKHIYRQVEQIENDTIIKWK